jgi:hypothetical protein
VVYSTKERIASIAITPASAPDEGRRLFEELGFVACAGRLVEAPPAVCVVLAEGELEPVPGLGPFVLGEGFTGTGVLEAAEAWEVMPTGTVGVGAVWVATTIPLCVNGGGVTVAVEVEGPTSGCALCAEQNEMNGSNSGSTYVCSVIFVESPFATTQSLQAPRSVSKAEPLAQRAGVFPTFRASM